MVEDVLDTDFNSAMESLVFTPLENAAFVVLSAQTDLDACSYGHNAFGYALKKRIYSQSAAAGLITTISDFHCSCYNICRPIHGMVNLLI